MAIPTSHKQKLPRGWSYAIGAERLSSILGDVPQAATLRLSFHPSEFILMADQMRAVSSGEPVALCSISYEHLRPGLTGSNDGFERGWYDEKWEIMVHAVPSSYRRAAEDAIASAGERLRSWLTTPRTDVWRYGGHSCALRMRLSDGEVTFHQQ